MSQLIAPARAPGHYRSAQAPIAQPAEAFGSNPIQCGFESHSGHRSDLRERAGVSYTCHKVDRTGAAAHRSAQRRQAARALGAALTTTLMDPTDERGCCALVLGVGDEQIPRLPVASHQLVRELGGREGLTTGPPAADDTEALRVEAHHVA